MRNRYSNHFHLCTSLCILMVVFFITGCGKSKDIETYKANMTQFFENIQTLDESINNLDPESDNIASELLPLLDSLDKSFSQMASLEVPDDFPGVSELSKDASQYMTEAVSYYHQAYEAEEYDQTSADIAYQNYQFANKRLQYIIQILHGDIPEEIFTYEDTDSDTDSSSDTDISVPVEDSNPENRDSAEVSSDDDFSEVENWEEDEFAY